MKTDLATGPFLFVLFAALSAGMTFVPTAGAVSILLDEVHGCPAYADLSAVLPACEVTPLTAADFPIETVLAGGVIVEPAFETTFDVPAGVEVLYGRFVFDGAELQLPYVRLYDPQGTVIAAQCRGSFHVEDPEPGSYRMVYDTWEMPMTTSYELGTGPPFLTAEIVAGYDLVCNRWDDTFMLFAGELPPYSSDEEGVLESFVESGGAYLYLREPLVEIVLKPIVNLYVPHGLNSTVDLVLPGLLTYADPPCLTRPVDGGTLCRWDDLPVPQGERAQILYESKPYRRNAWLAVTVAGSETHVTNRTEHPLLDLCLLRRLGRDDWELSRIASLPGGATHAVAPGQRLSRASLADRLREGLREGGRKAGLYADEIEEFIAHYHWDERWLADADDSSGWCAMYRLSPAAYDSFIPAAATPQPAEMARALWVWATGLGGEIDAPEPLLPVPPEVVPDPSDLGGLVYHEYGVLRQRGSGGERKAVRSPAFLGWEFYDAAFIIDPYYNCGEPECVLYYWSGGHPAAAEILTPGHLIRGLGSGVIMAPWSDVLLAGDQYCETADGQYPPGSFPPVAAVREQGAGRIAAFHDKDVLDQTWHNQEFVGNLVNWLARVSTAVPDLPSAHGQLVAVQPNPFNPRVTLSFRLERTESLRLAVYDPTGKFVTELAVGDYPAGTHDVTWEGRDAAGNPVPSGVYLARIEAGGVTDVEKLVLVR